ncbi:uncharacterized protein EURHEDRAFT_518284 [Aspergillus ruber CBS 135680]|uniref:Uncharacterized protein n=1 Tax=Aspergillus ruber (strain CBS 135680) TaxID=1388766 RepID=A0A017S448_ASPRC|nr:uncharacterized protein EURHEDRAFT_518284 [Aspergillus ruber CBS 135680]EYE91586.1 hypothetical protein EURHEDRAFT_518284 [Aspergillus ruber CBS 135680]
MNHLESRAYKFWNYAPSIPAAPINLVEIIGYIGRCVAHNNTTTMGPYIIANIFILLGPTLFAASIYITLERLIRRVQGEHLSLIRVTRLTKTFVWGGMLSFVVQGNSSSLSSAKPGIPWVRSLHMLYAVSALILYVMGNDGYPLVHEWTMYIFDSVPMVVVMVIFFMWYPDQMSLDTNPEGGKPLTQS